MLKLSCPECQTALKLANSQLAGKLIKCPKCSVPIRVPVGVAEGEGSGGEPLAEESAGGAPEGGEAEDQPDSNANGPTVSSTVCSACKAKLKLANPVAVGKMIRCPKCSQPVRVVEDKEEDAPPVNAVSRTICPECQATHRFPKPVPIWKLYRCPSCGKNVKVVEAPEAEPSSAITPAKEDMDFSALAKDLAPGDAADEEVKPPEPPPAPAKKKKKNKGVLVCGILGLIVVVAAGALGAYSLLQPETQTQAQSEWGRFYPLRGYCHVMMPGTPIRQVTRGNPQNIKVILRRPTSFKLKADDGVFTVGWVTVPPAREGIDKQKAVADVAKSELEQTKGQLVSEKPLDLDGHPGKQIVARVGKKLQIIRVYLVQKPTLNRYYFLSAAGDWDSPEDETPAQFLNSFQLTETGLKPPPPSPLQKLIVGKWVEAKKGGTVEYKKDGTMVLNLGKAKINGKYRFLSKSELEMALTMKGELKFIKVKVEIDGSNLKTTDDKGRSQTFSRVKPQ